MNMGLRTTSGLRLLLEDFQDFFSSFHDQHFSHHDGNTNTRRPSPFNLKSSRAEETFWNYKLPDWSLRPLLSSFLDPLPGPARCIKTSRTRRTPATASPPLSRAIRILPQVVHDESTSTTRVQIQELHHHDHQAPTSLLHLQHDEESTRVEHHHQAPTSLLHDEESTTSRVQLLRQRHHQAPTTSFSSTTNFLSIVEPDHVDLRPVKHRRAKNQVCSRTSSTSFLKPGDPRAPTIGSGPRHCCSKKLGRCMNKDQCPRGYYKCHNGCMNLKKIEWHNKPNALAAEKITLDGDFHVKSIDQVPMPRTKNKGKPCLEHCHGATGPCDYCGNGLCCKMGEAGNRCDGDIGGEELAVCARRPVEPSKDPVRHLNEACDAVCGFEKGPCPAFCGGGLCCAHGESGRGCDGTMGLKSYFSRPQRVCVNGRPPPDAPPSGGDLFWQGLQIGAEIMVVNGDSTKFRNQAPAVLQAQLNNWKDSEIYVMGPPSRNPRCSDAQNYCNMRGDTLDRRFSPPLGCKDHIGCDSDQVCCCQKTGRNFPCEEDEYEMPNFMNKSMCSLAGFEQDMSRMQNLLGESAWRGWSDERTIEA
ncbi:unnamed protein product [Amoebophrya sp. A25]|nr:unnamed protein product [Amoebophrya sp. A25]|eukprot:GSA25T00022125001.1